MHISGGSWQIVRVATLRLTCGGERACSLWGKARLGTQSKELGSTLNGLLERERCSAGLLVAVGGNTGDDARVHASAL